MIDILYEDADIIVVNKRSNMPSQKDLSRTPDVLTLVNQYTKKECFLIHRLDRHVAGPMVVAKTKHAAAFLNLQLQSKSLVEGLESEGFQKEYIAVVVDTKNLSEQNSDKEWTNLVHYQRKVNNLAISITPEVFDNLSDREKNEYKKATLRFCILSKKSIGQQRILLLKIDLLSGRYHQIRSQLAALGLPIYGDPKYGLVQIGDADPIKKIGLQSTSIGFVHPKTKVNVMFSVQHMEEPFDLFNR